MNSGAPFVSVVVPVLNEARLLGDFLQQLRALGSDLEIIVVDGGSCDESVSIAENFADQVMAAPRGRASQMNAGAQIARGKVFWFLHADLRVPRVSVERIRSALADPQTVGGYFRLRYPRSERVYRVSDSLGNVGVGVFGFALGDHGIFCRREAFLHAGGYPGVPILEDAALCRRLNRRGRMRHLREAIVSDPRTFERCGRYRTTALYFLILVLYVIGVPIPWLNKIYGRFQARTREQRGGIVLTAENEASH